jgi:hypothetical protein
MQIWFNILLISQYVCKYDYGYLDGDKVPNSWEFLTQLIYFLYLVKILLDQLSTKVFI